MSTFDPATFLDSVTTESYVKAPPLPSGDYTAIIKDITSREWVSKKPDAKIKSGVALDIVLTLELPPDVRDAMNSDATTITLTDSVMLNLNSSGGIDFSPGKNRHLGSYRDATDTNNAGEEFRARLLIGKVLLVKTKLEEYQGSFYAKVDKVAKTS